MGREAGRDYYLDYERLLKENGDLKQRIAHLELVWDSYEHALRETDSIRNDELKLSLRKLGIERVVR